MLVDTIGHSKNGRIDHYMHLPHKIVLRVDEDDGGFNAKIPALKGCVAWAKTKQEVLDVIQDVKKAWIEIAIGRGRPIPEPDWDELRRVFADDSLLDWPSCWLELGKAAT